MIATHPTRDFPLTQIKVEKLSYAWMILLHLLPGALTVLLMLLVAPLLKEIGIFPSVPVLFVFVAPILILMQLGFLYAQGRRRNGKFSLQGIVLYRDNHMPWWKIVGLALPILAWIGLVFFAVKPPVNRFFVQHFFTWMPIYFLDENFVNNLDQYSPAFLKVIGILFTLSITLGGAVEELYFRGYLLPRMEHLGFWAPVANTVLFSLYHFWSPWENAVRFLALSPWIFAAWRTRNIYLPLMIHIVINAFSGISLFFLVLNAT